MNEKPQHTPGPWVFDEKEQEVCREPGYGILDSKGNPIFVHVSASFDKHRRKGLWKDSTTAKANARLIAAAPEMLDVLIQVSEILNSPEIAAVIAKAKGEAR